MEPRATCAGSKPSKGAQPATSGGVPGRLLTLLVALAGSLLFLQFIRPTPGAGSPVQGQAVDLQRVLANPGDPERGARLYANNCSSCHGESGFGAWVPAPDSDRIVNGPALLSPEFQSLVSDEWLLETITGGRPGTPMIAMRLPESGLADLLAWLRQQWLGETSATVAEAVALSGEVDNGTWLYDRNCAPCHGFSGEGGWAPSLFSPEFQALADTRFLAETVVNGRRDYGMPSYRYLSAQEVADLIAAIRTLPLADELPAYFTRLSGSDGSNRLAIAEQGESIFRTICSQCHARDGQGGVGPALFGPDFLGTASDEFITNIVAYGRTGTGMRGFLPDSGGLASLELAEIRAVVAYIRTQQGTPAAATGRSRVTGDAHNGQRIYDGLCRSCHGRDGNRGTAPEIGSRHFQDTVSDGFLAATILLGRTGGGMHAFGEERAALASLDTGELIDLLTYIRSLSSEKTN